MRQLVTVNDGHAMRLKNAAHGALATGNATTQSHHPHGVSAFGAIYSQERATNRRACHQNGRGSCKGFSFLVRSGSHTPNGHPNHAQLTRVHAYARALRPVVLTGVLLTDERSRIQFKQPSACIGAQPSHNIAARPISGCLHAAHSCMAMRSTS